MKILVGADPEFFLMKDGKFVSAHGMVQGDKKKPLKVSRGAVQVDGMALEFNIDPASSEDEFHLNITTVMGLLYQMVPGYTPALVPVAEFGHEYIAEQPKEAKELGCEPDFNAWTSSINEKPNEDLPFRTASGHVHIGWGEVADVYEPSHTGNCEAVTKQMDFFLGLPSLLYDKDTKRRAMYGKGGCYRPKSYGVEYRTLSNAWLQSEERIKWVYRNVQEGMRRLFSGDRLVDKYGDISDIINTSDVATASAIIKEAKIEAIYG